MFFLTFRIIVGCYYSWYNIGVTVITAIIVTSTSFITVIVVTITIIINIIAITVLAITWFCH